MASKIKVDELETVNGSGTIALQNQLSGMTTASLPSGSVLQIVNFHTGAVATGTTAIPFDDTIPQITEGDEYMTLAITPTNSSNKLLISIVAAVNSTASNAVLTGALFQDSTANALAAQQTPRDKSTNAPSLAVIEHVMVAGTTSATTFRFRMGALGSATNTFNGSGGGRLYGGVANSSITITEYKA
jgi:hypothetical protein